MEKLQYKLSPEFVQESNRTLQQELFALPIAPKLVATLHGMELYSSENLRNKYIDAMYKISRVKSVAQDIERLIKQEKIIPCWINRGLFRLALFKKLAPRSDQGTAAFFSMTSKQIFILMDNNIEWGFAKDKELANLMLHELMHMASDKFKNKFIGMFWNEFVNYYTACFQEIFRTIGSINEEIKLIIRFLFKNFEYGNHNSGTLEKYLNLVNQCFRKKSSLNEIDFNSVLTDFYHYIALYFKDINALYKQLGRRFTHIYRGLTNGYLKGLEMRNDQSFCGQEFFYPSEVISMYVEFYQGSLSKPFNVIKQL